MRAMTRASSGTLGKPYRWPDPSVVAYVEAKDEGVPHRQAIEEQHEAVQEPPAANTHPSADIEGRCEQEQRVEGEDPGVEAPYRARPTGGRHSARDQDALPGIAHGVEDRCRHMNQNQADNH